MGKRKAKEKGDENKNQRLTNYTITKYGFSLKL